MYGQYCPGFIYDTQEDAMLDLVGCIFEVCQSGYFTDQDLEDLKADISSFKIDSLGRSVILYFPNIALEGN
jgi:hypothetical protein